MSIIGVFPINLRDEIAERKRACDEMRTALLNLYNEYSKSADFNRDSPVVKQVWDLICNGDGL